MPILRERHAKILATVGPSSNTKDKIKQLVEAGADAFRLNFSHGSHEDHRKNVANIRQVAEELGQNIAILQDLQGPKIRIGVMEEATVLHIGQTFVLDDDPTAGTAERVHLPHPEILEVLKPGDKVYINDGLVRLSVTGKSGNRVFTEVKTSGVVSSRKGCNLPGVDLPMSAMTEKDKADLKFGLEQGVDWVALSFVQRGADVAELRELIGNNGAKIVSKIEMPQAVDRLEEILALSDGIMIARGDLGVEVPLEEVPSIQKRIIRLCREAGKPVITATQMLESMTKNPQPTRAEVSDVANATFEGSDVLMLSAESASGDYPVEAVQTMSNIINRAERSSAWRPLMDARHPEVEKNVSDAIAHAAFNLAESLPTCALVTFTEVGGTALRMSRQRPLQPILTITPSLKVARQLALSWGINARVMEQPVNIDALLEAAQKLVEREGLAVPGTNIIVTAGTPLGISGSTNMVRVITL